MKLPNRPIAFVLAASNQGSLIVNRHDYRMVDANRGYGVGFQILSKSSFDPEEVRFALALLDCRRKFFGDGVVAIDGGANIGVQTVEWARHTHGWGQVLAFEAQEVIFYALAGNIVLNNCLNARARHAALGAQNGRLDVPRPDYFSPASFGSLELRKSERTEFIGQQISYAAERCEPVDLVAIDSLQLPRLDLAKIDVEGMELDVLAGMRETLERTRPVLIVEAIKCDRAALESLLTESGYRWFAMGLNLLAVHQSDPTLGRITARDKSINISVP